MLIYIRKYKWSLLWALTILILTFLPKQDIPEVKFLFRHLDKVVHFTFYFVLILLFLAETKRPGNYYLTTIGFLCCIALGIGTEYGQTWMKLGRTFEWSDMAANILGSIAGLVLFKVLLNTRTRKK